MTPADSKRLAIYNRLQQIHVLLDDGDRRALAGMDLSSPQYHALLHMHSVGESGMTVTELANHLICTRGNATRLIQRLEGRELVELNGDPNDRRIVRVSLTETGLAMFQNAQTAHVESVRRRFGQLDRKALQALFGLMNELVDHLLTDLDATDA